MLADKGAAVNANYFISEEGLPKHLGSTTVVVGLIVGGIEHGFVQDEEVGIGGRQAFAIFEDSIGHR